MEDAYEELVRWYLRFNGYMSVENFIVHEPAANASMVPQGTELDTLAVRFPFSREVVEGIPTKEMRNDPRLVIGTGQPTDPVDFVIAEVKSGERVRLNSVWREPTEPVKEHRIKYVLRWLGPLPDEAVIADLAHRIQTQHSVCEHGYSFRLILFTHRKNRQGVPSSVLTITFSEILRFIVDSRASSWSQMTIAQHSHHPQWSDMVNAIWRLAGPDHAGSPENKVTDMLATVEQENRLRASECLLHNLVLELLCSPLHPFDEKLRGILPEEHGIYIVYDCTTSPATAVRAGRTTTATGGLRQRIYNNHLMGNQSGNLRQQLVADIVCNDLTSAKRYVREHCQVRFLRIDDDRLRCWAEHYLLAVVRPKYGD